MASAQQDSGPATYDELERQSAEALAKSEAKVKTWFADPQVQALKARADGGDARAQVQFADKIRDDIMDEVWSRENIQQTMMKYYATAMGQNSGAAFARIGELAESPDYSYALKRGSRDLGEAFSYYEKGAELGDRDAIAGYLRIASNPNFCSFCDDGNEVKYNRKKLVEAGVIAADEGYGNYIDRVRATYRTEKRATLAKAVKFVSAGRLERGDAAAHHLATLLMSGIQVPNSAREVTQFDEKADLGTRITAQSRQWLLRTDLPEAERVLLGLSMRNDVLAMRKLADLYLKGVQREGSVSIAPSTANYLYHMKHAVEQGSIIAAYMVGFQLMNGKDIPADPARGVDYVATAAAAGFGPAEELAGFAFRDGIGTEKNPEVALKLFERAANNGQAQAAEEAAAMYRAGYGSDQPGIRSAAALALAAKAKQMRELSPTMAEVIRRAHWDKFQ